jgi:hypothetical protein
MAVCVFSGCGWCLLDLAPVEFDLDENRERLRALNKHYIDARAAAMLCRMDENFNVGIMNGDSWVGCSVDLSVFFIGF